VYQVPPPEGTEDVYEEVAPAVGGIIH